MSAGRVALSPFTLENEGGSRLGAGAAATVYRARDPRGRAVALKVLDQELAADSLVADAFLAQARAMAGIRASGLVEIYEVGRLDDGRPFVSMEVLEGRSLAEVVARERVLGPMRAARLGILIAEALAALHDRGTLHGDLHPGNVQLLDGDRVCLLDAGGAHADTSVPGGVLFGSAEYLAPELVTGAPRTAAADVYAAGVILYEALVGKTPFGSHSVTDVIEQQLHVEPRTVRAPAGLTPVPPALEAVVLRCLKKDPTERYVDGSTLARALAVVRQDLTPPMVAAITRPAGRRWRKVALPAAIGFGLLTLSVWLLATQRPDASTYVPLYAAQANGSDTALAATPAQPVTVTIDVTSEPDGASVSAVGGEWLGTTPTRIELPVSTTPIRLGLRFPGGETTEIEVVPDRPARVHAQSPELHRYLTAPVDGARPRRGVTSSKQGKGAGR